MTEIRVKPAMNFVQPLNCELVWGDCPVTIPTPDDYPFIGHWPTEALVGAVEAFAAVEVGDLEEEMAETIMQMRGWIEAAMETPGRMVVGFLS